MPSTNPSDWQAVDGFATENSLQTIESAIARAGVAAERFQSGEGERALLVPAGPLAQGKIPGIAVTDVPAQAEAVAFLDPVSGASAVGLLAALAGRAPALRVALPEEADPAGLVGEAGSVRVATGVGAPVTYRLFAGAGPDPKVLRRPSNAPELGEGVDVLDQRGDWFQRREGGRA